MLEQTVFIHVKLLQGQTIKLLIILHCCKQKIVAGILIFYFRGVGEESGAFWLISGKLNNRFSGNKKIHSFMYLKPPTDRLSFNYRKYLCYRFPI